MSARILVKSIETLSHRWGKLTNTTLQYVRRGGTLQTHQREVYDHGNGAAVLLYDSARGHVVLVKQFRLPVFNDGQNGWILETAAGLLDADDPEVCARKEALEETGIEVQSLHFAFEAFSSPGSLSEKLYCYIGTYSGPITTQLAGLADEGEEIEVIELPLQEALGMIKTGEIIDAKAIMLLQHLALENIKSGED